MNINVNLQFYRISFQCDESHYEETFFTVGTPKKPFQEVVQEARKDFLFRVSERENLHLTDCLDTFLLEHGFHKVVPSDVECFDEYDSNSKDVKKTIQATLKHTDGETYIWGRNEELLQEINEIRQQRGKHILN